MPQRPSKEDFIGQRDQQMTAKMDKRVLESAVIKQKNTTRDNRLLKVETKDEQVALANRLIETKREVKDQQLEVIVKRDKATNEVKSYKQSLMDTVNSGEFMIGTPIDATEEAFKQIHKWGVKEIPKYHYPKSVGVGKALKWIEEDLGAFTSRMTKATNVANFAGKAFAVAGPLVSGYEQVQEDQKKYKGDDLNKALMITTATTAVSIIVGIGLASLSLPFLLTLGIGIATTAAIDYGFGIYKINEIGY